MPHTRGRRQYCSSSSSNCNNNNCSRNSSNINNSASGNCCSRIKCVVASYSLAASHYMAESQSSAELPHCYYGKVGKGLQRGSCRTELNRRPQFEFAFDARSIDRLRKSFAAKYIELAADGELVKVNTSHTQAERETESESGTHIHAQTHTLAAYIFTLIRIPLAAAIS